MNPPRARVLNTNPLFVVSDLDRSLAFYVEKLGYGEPSTFGDPPCFAMLHRDLYDLMLSLAETPEAVRPNGPLGVWDMYVKVTDIHSEIEALKALGVEIVRGPETMFYQMAEIEVIDPDGYRICLAQDVTRTKQ